MKIEIQARPGELRTRSDDLKKIIARLVGDHCDHDHGEDLSKGQKISDQIDQGPRKLDYKVLQASVDAAQKNVDRVTKVMLKKFDAVLKKASKS